jgi:hypothetical protein
MADTVRDLDKRITAAYHALNGARAAATHSPNRETIRLEEMCERTVNDLLDKRNEMTRVPA